MNQSASAVLSTKPEANLVKAKANEANKRATDTNNVSKEKHRTKQSAGRIVQSRYRTGIVSKDSSSSNNSSNSKSSNNSSNGSNSSIRNNLNNTVNLGSSSACKKQVQKAKLPRASLASKPKASGIIGGSSSNLPRTLGTASHTSTYQQGESQKSKSSLQVNRAKLHSTILNATMRGDVTNLKSSDNVFSTTMVGGLAPGGRKLDVTGAVLPDLPDISAIKLDSVSSENRSGDTTILSSVTEKDTSQESDSSSSFEVTSEELEQEYLSYLQWAYIDHSSMEAFNIQLKELQTQLSFLEQQVCEKQFEFSRRKQMAEVIHHYNKVFIAYEKQESLLQALVDGLPACEEAEKTMSRELEKNLHQVKMDSLYVPENHQKYRDLLLEALHEQLSVLNEIQSLMKGQSLQLNSTNGLLGEVQDVVFDIQQCENEVQQAARLAVQEASLHVGARQMKVSGCSGPAENEA
ncbi:uncharacterized protein [Panulirus ornatus]|uniref:uncharacterized protein n=1 Tax=Panulirus ornatus TaxID=150431 RepID=UPI003A86C6F9